MKFIISAITSVMLLFTAATTHANEAPLGLTWGMTKSQLESAGVKYKCEIAHSADYCYTKNPPAPLSFGDVYALVFIKNIELQSILIYGKNITNDSYGDNGKKQYDSLKSILIKKYGQPTSNTDFIGVKLYDRSDEFYQCLAYDGCGLWGTVWKTDTLSILLQLDGISRGKGYIRINYETKAFLESLDSDKQQNMKKDEYAL